MSLLQYQKLFKQKFEEALQAKTSWGRNDLMNLFHQTSSEAALELIRDSETFVQAEPTKIEPKNKLHSYAFNYCDSSRACNIYTCIHCHKHVAVPIGKSLSMTQQAEVCPVQGVRHET